MAMKEMLSKTGVKAGRAKRQLLSRPPDGATSDMKKDVGKVMRVSVDGQFRNLSASALKPGARSRDQQGAWRRCRWP